MQQPPLTTAEVARLLAVTPARIRQLDDALRPVRLGTGQRLYDAKRVDALAGQRAAREVSP